MNELLSVIIPVYNSQNYLEECIESVLKQKYTNIELILVDDGSTDLSGDICDNYSEKDSRVKVIHCKNAGQASARNKGIECAQGEYITFVDSDDWIGENYFSQMLNMRPFDIVYGGCTKVYKKENIEVCLEISEVSNKELIKNEQWVRLFNSSLFGYAGMKIYKKELLEGAFYENHFLREDMIFNLQILKKAKKIAFMSSKEYFYRQHDESTLHSQYSKEVPEITNTCKFVLECMPGDECTKIEIYNQVVKTYIIDVISKCVINHTTLTKKGKIAAIKKLFSCSTIRDNLVYRREDCRLHKVFYFCYKYNFPRLYLGIQRRI